MQAPVRFKLQFVVVNGKEIVFEYARSLRSRWRISNENDAVAFLNALDVIEHYGPQGTMATNGFIELYVMSDDRHRIAHAPHPDDSQTIFVISAFDKSDLANGQAQAWRLIRATLGLAP